MYNNMFYFLIFDKSFASDQFLLWNTMSPRIKVYLPICRYKLQMNVKDITSLSTLVDRISNRVSFIVMSFHVHNTFTDPLKDITVTMEI